MMSRIFCFLENRGAIENQQNMERLSFIPTDDYIKWFSPVWDDIRGQFRRDHPAPFPIEIPRRLIRMYSFVGDTVVDPFAGTGTTALAALETGRNSVSVEIEPTYVEQIRLRLRSLSSLTTKIRIHSKERTMPVVESRTA
jgi:DNA modification methylase